MNSSLANRLSHSTHIISDHKKVRPDVEMWQNRKPQTRIPSVAMVSERLLYHVNKRLMETPRNVPLDGF